MLEQQQAQLVAGLQETYRRLQAAQLWPGAPFEDVDGHVLTHDILARLDILNNKDGESELFEEDTDKLQSRLLSQGATYMHRRGSLSSDSEHSHIQGHSRSRSHDSPVDSPLKPVFRQSFAFDNTAASSPTTHSPAQFASQLHQIKKPSPLHNQSPIQDDVSSFDISISNTDNEYLLNAWDFDSPEHGQSVMRSHFALQQPAMHDHMPHGFNSWQAFDPMHYNSPMLPSLNLQAPPLANMHEWVEPSELDMSKFIQVS